jgi:hypothetical protein
MSPIYPRPEDILLYDGPYFSVEWYYTESGHLPAYDYFRRMPEADQLRLRLLVKYMADSPHGTRLPMNLYRIEDRAERIFAFKPRAERFFNFTTDESAIIITNAYHKHAQRMSRADLDQLQVAVRSRRDYMRRVREGSYYEAQ